MKFLQTIITLILTILWSQAYALDFSSFGLLSQKEAILKAIQRDELLRPHYTYESSISNFAGKNQCISINHSLHKGERLRSNSAFKWVIDVPVNGEVSERTKVGIAELDALVSVELLKRERVSVDSDSETNVFDRYSLTVKGWAETVGRKKGNSCFYLGRAKQLSVVNVEKIAFPISRDKKDTVYKVTAKVGFPKDLKLPYWTNHPDIRKAFPLIDKLISGYERNIFMEKSGDRWREYLSPSAIKRMKKAGGKRSDNYFSEDEPTTERETMLDAFSFQDHVNKYWSCISLPGDSSNGVRVDKNLEPRNQYKYSVAIFDNKKRSKWDNIETKTKPYLERLVSAGLLTFHFQTEIEGEKRDRGQVFNGTVYQLAPEYEHIIDQERGCIYLGKGKVSVVDLKILSNNTRALSFGRESVKYKYIMTFPNPPKWAKDRVLQAWWSDLKGALEYGLACDGTFEIDLTKKRKLGAGAGSCWWAYDSVAE
jgi:hypothetical protein